MSKPKSKTSILGALQHHLGTHYQVIASDTKSNKQIRMYTSSTEDMEFWKVKFVVVGWRTVGAYRDTKTFDSLAEAVEFYEKEL